MSRVLESIRRLTPKSRSRKFSPITSTAYFCTSAFTRMPSLPAAVCFSSRRSTSLRDFFSSRPVSKLFFCIPGFMIAVYSLQFSPCELMMLSPTRLAITDHGILT